MRSAIGLLLLVPSITLAQAPRPRAEGLSDPRAVAVGQDGRAYVTVAGAVVAVDAQGKVARHCGGLTDPRGIAAYQNVLFVADADRVLRVDLKGKVQVLASAKAFPTAPRALHGLAVDAESGLVYVGDAGAAGVAGAVYQVHPKGKVRVVVDERRWPGLRSPRAVVNEGASYLIVADGQTGELRRVRIADGTNEKIAANVGSGDGLVWDWHGRLYIADARGGRALVIGRPETAPIALPRKLRGPLGLALARGGKEILVVEGKAGALAALPTGVPGASVDESPLPLETVLAFPDLKWDGWEPEDARGRPKPLRPLVLTHAGDGSGRIFVATQHGVIHAFPNNPRATRTKVFLDIQKQIRYRDDKNEEGLLGLAFHPKYRENGQFFVFYTQQKQGLINVLSRFRVRKDDPDRADPASEEVLLTVKRPFWNHDGGTILFGPDGYLYLALGDGGAANDPFDNAQNLGTLLGSILRLDIDRKSAGTAYAIPMDNPFVGRKGARPEIWAHGLRNVWRMAFDRSTGRLWAADVGQNLFEEIDLIVKGGNYGWRRREGLHPFDAKGMPRRSDWIDPIWEYHHDVGRSITGGLVYRGKRLPELTGHFLYADYVSGKLWALQYDEQAKRVTANRTLRDRNLPILSFGEDDRGEAYLLAVAADGRGIYTLRRIPKATR